MREIREKSRKVIQRGMKRRKTLALAGFLIALDSLMPLTADYVPKGLFIALSLIVGVGAFVVKNEVKDGD